jgi:hypothetical protein
VRPEPSKGKRRVEQPMTSLQGFWNPDEDPEYLDTPLISPILPVGFRNPPGTRAVINRPEKRAEKMAERGNEDAARERMGWKEREDLEGHKYPERRSLSPPHHDFGPVPPPPPNLENEKPTEPPAEWISSESDWDANILTQIVDNYTIDYDDFCDDGETAKDMLESVEKLLMKEDALVKKAKINLNSYENVGRHLFTNRSAMQLANLDALTGITEHMSNGFKFADLCGGPGGFTEYILWRGIKRDISISGFGLTLPGQATFDTSKLRRAVQNLLKSNPEMFASEELKPGREAMEQWIGKHQNVQLVLAHGPLEATDIETTLLVTELALAFGIIAEGGAMVLKVGNLLHPLPVSLLYLMYMSFEKVTLVKPLMSPASLPDKYIVAKGFKASRDISLHLMDCLNKSPLKSVVQIDLLKEDTFQDWLARRNLRLMLGQQSAVDHILQHLETGRSKQDFVDEEHLLRSWNLFK